MQKIVLPTCIVAVGVVSYFFFLLSDKQTGSDKAVLEQARVDLPLTRSEIQPTQLLAAKDVVTPVKEALLTTDDEQIQLALNEQIARVISVTGQLRLTQSDQTFIQSEQAKHFLLFTAKRDLFDDMLEQKYHALEPIEELKRQYPEANDKFEYADSLIQKRDSLLRKLEAAYVEQGLTVVEAAKRAKAEWLKRNLEMKVDNAN